VALAAGDYRLTVRPVEPLTGPLMNLRSVRLVPAAPAPDGNAFSNAPEKVKQGKDGAIQLSSTKAEVHGPGVIFEPTVRQSRLLVQCHRLWPLDVRSPPRRDVRRKHRLGLQDSTAGNHFRVVLDDKAVVEGEVLGTGTWDEYRKQRFGQVQLDPGAHRLEFRAAGEIKNALIDLRTVILVPAEESGRTNLTQIGRDDVFRISTIWCRSFAGKALRP